MSAVGAEGREPLQLQLPADLVGKSSSPAIEIVPITFRISLASNASISYKVDQLMTRMMQELKIPGVSVGIIREGTVVHARGYGYANVEHQVLVKLETVFQSGSVGKQFTAMAVMILIDQGKLHLDDSIRVYFTDSPIEWSTITVRHLLTHTSGMSDYPESINFRADYSEEQIYEVIKKISLLFQPGNQWKYSNLGYVMLGILIHRVSGQFYGDFLQDNVFGPLNMTTARVIGDADIIPNRASGYVLTDGALKNQPWVSPTLNSMADGALYLTFYDMLKWNAALDERRLLPCSESFDEMWSPVKLNNGTYYPYGFGWRLPKAVNGMRIVEHGGVWQGFQSMIIRVLDAKVTVIFFANLNHLDVYTLGRLVLQLYDPDLAVVSI